MLCLLLPALLSSALGHGSVSIPPPRQGIDSTVAPWNETVPDQVPFMFWCAVPDAMSADHRNVSGRNGQACFWYVHATDFVVCHTTLHSILDIAELTNNMRTHVFAHTTGLIMDVTFRAISATGDRGRSSIRNFCGPALGEPLDGPTRPNSCSPTSNTSLLTTGPALTTTRHSVYRSAKIPSEKPPFAPPNCAL